MGRDDITAPLGGIIVLAQSRQNTIEKLEPGKAASRLFGRIYSSFRTEKEVLLAAGILDRILQHTSVWLLRNKGDKDSAILTHKVLEEGERP